MIRTIVYGWIATAVIFAILDLIWLSFVANGFYRSQMGDFRGDSVNLVPVILFYLTMVTSSVIFVVPAVRSGEVWLAAGSGAFFGFVCTPFMI